MKKAVQDLIDNDKADLEKKEQEAEKEIAAKALQDKI
jgi:hypothetical protein